MMKKWTLILTLLLLACSVNVYAYSRSDLFQALKTGRPVHDALDILHPARKLVHFAHVCSLKLNQQTYPVVDLQEVVVGSMTPRGVNQIIVLDPHLKIVQHIAYTTERPLFCLENRLYVYGEIRLYSENFEGGSEEGNVLTFTQSGRRVSLRHIEAHAYPLPLIQDMKTPPQ